MVGAKTACGLELFAQVRTTSRVVPDAAFVNDLTSPQKIYKNHKYFTQQQLKAGL
ncbi:hypothetical protein SAMN04515668_1359 [Hymenobacter arizonensis]|uniref:Uncharacterized protein n=1 Tax=Hymenobacter arizonensis TaxID=1227077 RepID=A0A1I5WJL2_HYMAR|nr:hypothetical protein SAMN04515668_1359 [Hymenobacter arizonensis]